MKAEAAGGAILPLSGSVRTMYRIVTTDGFVLGEHRTRKEADVLAEQQAGQLQEKIVIEKRDQDGLFEKIGEKEYDTGRETV